MRLNLPSLAVSASLAFGPSAHAESSSPVVESDPDTIHAVCRVLSEVTDDRNLTISDLERIKNNTPINLLWADLPGNKHIPAMVDREAHCGELIARTRALLNEIINATEPPTVAGSLIRATRVLKNKPQETPVLTENQQNIWQYVFTDHTDCELFSKKYVVELTKAQASLLDMKQDPNFREYQKALFAKWKLDILKTSERFHENPEPELDQGFRLLAQFIDWQNHPLRVAADDQTLDFFEMLENLYAQMTQQWFNAANLVLEDHIFSPEKATQLLTHYEVLTGIQNILGTPNDELAATATALSLAVKPPIPRANPQRLIPDTPLPTRKPDNSSS